MATSSSDTRTNFEEYGTFDWELYGLLVRKKRLGLGFRRAEDFAESVYRRTRVTISRDVLYKIEQGRQVPDTMQFFALNIALCGEPWPSKLLDMCLGSNWEYIRDRSRDNPDGMPYVPERWAYGNWQDYQRTPDGMDVAFNGHASADPWDIAKWLGDSENLFDVPPYC